jgi:hypothetical protein
MPACQSRERRGEKKRKVRVRVCTAVTTPPGITPVHAQNRAILEVERVVFDALGLACIYVLPLLGGLLT